MSSVEFMNHNCKFGLAFNRPSNRTPDHFWPICMLVHCNRSKIFCSRDFPLARRKITLTEAQFGGLWCSRKTPFSWRIFLTYKAKLRYSKENSISFWKTLKIPVPQVESFQFRYFRKKFPWTLTWFSLSTSKITWWQRSFQSHRAYSFVLGNWSLVIITKGILRNTTEVKFL